MSDDLARENQRIRQSMPRQSMPRHRKTRRHLKGRRRSRKQRGGANIAKSADEWISSVKDMFISFNDQLIPNLGALVRQDLTLSPPTDEERNKGTVSVSPMEFPVIENDIELSEDIRDVALTVRDILQGFVGNSALESVTPQEFSNIVIDTNRLVDDTFQDSLRYLLIRENAIRDRVSVAPLDTIAPATTLSAAAISKDMPLFIWALAVNISGDAQVAAFYKTAAAALSNTGSSESI